MDITFESMSGTAEFSDQEMEAVLNIEDLDLDDLLRLGSINDRQLSMSRAVITVEIDTCNLEANEEKAAELIKEDIEGGGFDVEIADLRASYDGDNLFSFETV